MKENRAQLLAGAWKPRNRCTQVLDASVRQVLFGWASPTSGPGAQTSTCKRLEALLGEVAASARLSQAQRRLFRKQSWVDVANDRKTWKAIIINFCKVDMSGRNEKGLRCGVRTPKVFAEDTPLNLAQYSNRWYGPSPPDEEEGVRGRQQLQGTFNGATSIDELPRGTYSSGDGGCEKNGKPDAKASFGFIFGMRQGGGVVVTVAEPVPRHLRQTNNCGELLAVRDQILFHIALTEPSDDCFIYSDSDYSLQVTVGGVAVRHKEYKWASKPENMALMKQVLAFKALLPSLRVLPVISHTEATDIATKWNAIADDLATLGLKKPANSEAYTTFCNAIDSIDLETRKPEMARLIKDAVNTFISTQTHQPAPTTNTNLNQ